MSNNDEQRDRISFDLLGLRPRLEKLNWEPGQPISSIVRGLIYISAEVLETCIKRKLPEPRPGRVDIWLDQIQNKSEITPKVADDVINFLSSQTRPEDIDIVNKAAELGIDTEKLLDLIDRIHYRQHCTNGN